MTTGTARSRQRDDGAPNRTDERQHRAEAARADRARNAAHKQGVDAGRKAKVHQRHPDPADVQYHGDAGPQYEQGFAAGRSEANRARVANLVPSHVSGGGQNFSGFVLALFGWALFVNYVRGGPAGVTAWLRAKFFNQPSSPLTDPLAANLGGGSGPRLAK